jgi:uncharacterized protein Smg (DUF494 family)
MLVCAVDRYYCFNKPYTVQPCLKFSFICMRRITVLTLAPIRRRWSRNCLPSVLRKAETTQEFATQYPQQAAFSFGIRVYARQETEMLGVAAIGFIQFLEAAKMLNPVQREIVVGRALAAGESPISLEKLKVIVLMVLWSQGKEPDGLMFDELFLDDEDDEPRLLH